MLPEQVGFEQESGLQQVTPLKWSVDIVVKVKAAAKVNSLSGIFHSAALPLMAAINNNSGETSRDRDTVPFSLAVDNYQQFLHSNPSGNPLYFISP